MSEIIAECGCLVGHTHLVTSISAPDDPRSNTIVSASRDKTIIVWELNRTEASYGIARSSLRGHSHFVQDVLMSSDGHYCLSGSWDGMVRLWDINTGLTIKRFEGHTKDVLSLAFSPDNRIIITGARDKTIRVWNIIGECKYVLEGSDGHTEWVSCVCFSPSGDRTMVSCGWDKLVKVWDLEKYRLHCNLPGHTGYLTTVSISPDGSLCASGGKDGFVMIWDFEQVKNYVSTEKLYQLPAGGIINAISFSPNRFWLCAATQTSIKIWDLESKKLIENSNFKDNTSPSPSRKHTKASQHYCTCLEWSAEGSTLFAGCTDGRIFVYSVRENI